MMQQAYRYRRRNYYGQAGRRTLPVRGLLYLLFVICLAIGFLWLLHRWKVQTSLQRQPVLLQFEGRSNVQFSLGSEELRPASSGTKLYPGDRIVSGAKSVSTLSLFDGTVLRLDEHSDLSIEETSTSGKSGIIRMNLDQGRAWIKTPEHAVQSSDIERTIRSPRLSFSFPDSTEALLTPNSVSVFSAARTGVGVGALTTRNTIQVEEGQNFAVPEGNVSDDLYQYRSILGTGILTDAFVMQSQEYVRTHEPEDVEQPATPTAASTAHLVINSPDNGTKFSGNTIVVRGRVGDAVRTVQVNGYSAVINAIDQSFVQEMSVAKDGPLSIAVRAYGEDGQLLMELNRLVEKKSELLPAPVITAPVHQNGSTTTSDQEIEIRGTTAPGTVNIIVNDYTLQLYKAGATSWSYVASTSIGNLKEGSNAFLIYALDRDGRKSNPATLTITVEKPASVTTTGTVPVPATSDNPPLKPGTLRVTGPGNGTSFTTAETAVLLEGTTDPSTSTLWINGYQLQLYQAGKPYWNYIASSKLRTLRRGMNTYNIVARNAQGQVVDRLTFSVTLNIPRPPTGGENEGSQTSSQP